MSAMVLESPAELARPRTHRTTDDLWTPWTAAAVRPVPIGVTAVRRSPLAPAPPREALENREGTAALGASLLDLEPALRPVHPRRKPLPVRRVMTAMAIVLIAAASLTTSGGPAGRGSLPARLARPVATAPAEASAGPIALNPIGIDPIRPHMVVLPSTPPPAPARPAAAPAPPPAPPAPKPSTLEYTVVSGDTMSSVAAAHGESLAQLEVDNPRPDFDVVHVGEHLLVRPGDQAQPVVPVAHVAAASAAAAAPAPVPAGSVQQMIVQVFGANSTWALRVAGCESSYDPTNVNPKSGAMGVFQFLPSTWAGTPWHADSPFNALDNIEAAKWLLATYGPGQWQCK